MAKQERTARLVGGVLFLALFFLWGVGYTCFPIFHPSIFKQFHLSRTVLLAPTRSGIRIQNDLAADWWYVRETG